MKALGVVSFLSGLVAIWCVMMNLEGAISPWKALAQAGLSVVMLAAGVALLVLP